MIFLSYSLPLPLFAILQSLHYAFEKSTGYHSWWIRLSVWSPWSSVFVFKCLELAESSTSLLNTCYFSFSVRFTSSCTLSKFPSERCSNIYLYGLNYLCLFTSPSITRFLFVLCLQVCWVQTLRYFLFKDVQCFCLYSFDNINLINLPFHYYTILVF